MRKTVKKRLLSFILAAALVVGSVYAIPTANVQAADADSYPWSPTATTGDYIADSYSGIGSGHVIESVTQERLLDILSSAGNYYIVFGSAKNETSQKVLPLINDQAKTDGITKIYYFDPVLDGYQLDISDKDTVFKGNFSWDNSGEERVAVTHSVYELWERIEALLPQGALEGYTSEDTLLLAYQNDRTAASIAASYLYQAGSQDEDSEISAQIAKVFRGGDEEGSVTASDERTDFEFFKRIYNAAATNVEGTTRNENRLGEAVEIFTDADKEGFALQQVGFKELVNILNSSGEHYIFFGASWCHNTQAIIGDVARTAKANNIETVYVYDTTIGNQLEFGTGDQIDTVVGRSTSFNSRTSVVTEEGATQGSNNISYLYGELVSYLGDFITENNTKKNNSISYYPAGNLSGTATTKAPWEEGEGEKNAIRLQMPFLIQYDKSKATPVTKQWLHKNSANDGTYTEYMLELAWVLATDEAKASTDTSIYDGLTIVQFAAEAVTNLNHVFGDAELVVTPPATTSPDVTPAPAQPTQEPGTGSTATSAPTQTPGAEVTAAPTQTPTSEVSKPKAPTIQKVKAGKKSATVSWKKVSGVKGYVIYQATSQNGKYKQVTTVAAKKTSYKVKKLKKNKKYFFKLRSYTLDGKKKVYSSYSKVKSVKVK